MSPALRLPLCLLAVVLAALLASGIRPYDRLTWWLEVAPVLIVLPLLLATARRFPLTPLLYWLIALHSLILILGGHYTYARVPLGLWAQELFDLPRNHYDRLGHIAQGFIPAIAARELLLRHAVVRRGAWLFLFVASICLAFSALYELIEWFAALVSAQAAAAFLGTQGDNWDTQWDMLLALLGTLTALCLLPRWHDRQLAALAKAPVAG